MTSSNKTFILSALAAATLVVACEKDSNAATRDTRSTVEQSIENAAQWTKAEWDRFVDTTSERVDAAKDELAELRDRVKVRGAEAGSELEPTLQNLDSRVQAAEAEVETLGDRTSEAWADAASRIDSTLDKIAAELDGARERLSGG